MTDQEIFRQYFLALAPEQQSTLNNIFNQDPKIFKQFESLFCRKLEAIRKPDNAKIEEISREEKDIASNLLGEIIKTNP